jgi:hypothetical protein
MNAATRAQKTNRPASRPGERPGSTLIHVAGLAEPNMIIAIDVIAAA